MTEPRIHFVGDDALAVETPGRAQRDSCAEFLRASRQWTDVVPGKHHVTVQFDPVDILPSQALAQLAEQVQRIPDTARRAGKAISLDLSIEPADAPDLARLAAENGLAIPDFLSRLQGSALTVDMLGFTPGFAYITGLDTALQGERLKVPRTRVAAGSVGMIHGQIGLYALPGPGGWPIIGRVKDPLFDPAAPQPSRLSPGMQVRFRIIGSAG
ncbi:MAG: carboxyltransferase domain-containing protein [Hyphomonas sp.]|nr:carboxyltransferase domain-containing protein [Hyphomonas sp.]